MNEPVPAKFQGFSAMLKKWNFDISELVGFLLWVSPKWLFFRNSCFKTFLLETLANLKLPDGYLATWEASCQYVRQEAAPSISSLWERLPKSSVATPGLFLNCVAGRLRGLVGTMTLGLSWFWLWSQDSQSWKLVWDSEGTETLSDPKSPGSSQASPEQRKKSC